jgi:hypothetical protein
MLCSAGEMARAYTMQSVRGAADRAVSVARAFLSAEDAAAEIHDVQADPRFQARGIDLLWSRSGGELLGVEVKGDRQAARRGNYFFELVSNLEKNTPGCFLYSTADLLLYVFLQRLEVHHLPLAATRSWFLASAERYPLRHTGTRLGAEGYTTVGALVPVRDVLRGVTGARRVPRSTWAAPDAAASLTP